MTRSFPFDIPRAGVLTLVLVLGPVLLAGGPLPSATAAPLASHPRTVAAPDPLGRLTAWLQREQASAGAALRSDERSVGQLFRSAGRTLDPTPGQARLEAEQLTPMVNPLAGRFRHALDPRMCLHHLPRSSPALAAGRLGPRLAAARLASLFGTPSGTSSPSGTVSPAPLAQEVITPEPGTLTIGLALSGMVGLVRRGTRRAGA